MKWLEKICNALSNQTVKNSSELWLVRNEIGKVTAACALGELVLQSSTKRKPADIVMSDFIRRCLKNYYRVPMGNLERVFDKINLWNHDVNFISRPEQSKFVLRKSCHYLENQELVIDGVKFFGMSFVDIVRHSIFETICERIDDRKKLYDSIPEDTDVLITHQPPDLPELSTTDDGFNLGCPFLMEAIRLVKPKIHGFGHVHRSYGMKKVDKTTFVNASSLNFNGTTLNKPIIVEI